MINILWSIMEKGDNIQEQTGNISRDSKIKSTKLMLKPKNMVPEIRNDFSGFISRPNIANKRIRELEDKSIETSQNKIQRGKTKTKYRNRTQLSRTVEQHQKV